MKHSARVIVFSLVIFVPSLALAQDTGVAACEDLAVKYGACVVEKVPEKERPRFMDQLTQWRLEWRALAAKPNSKLMLGTACGRALEEARASLGRYGCAF